MNKVMLRGNLARGVEIKDLGNGQLVGKSLIAVSRYGKREGTDYVRIVLWGKQAMNAAKYLAKGSSVSIVGRLRSEFYEQKNTDGQVRLNTEVVVDEIEYLSRPSLAAVGAAEAKHGK